MQYEIEYNNGENCLDSYNQFVRVYENMRDSKTGLYYHAYDESRKAFWADKETGLSQNFWLRALGWFAVAFVDAMEIMTDDFKEQREHLRQIFNEFMDSLINFQDESGMWYQVVDKAGAEGNYLEASGSALIAYALMKGVRLGFLEDKYYAYGEKAFKGVCDKYLTEKDGELCLTGICLVAGLGPEDTRRRDGSYEYYMSEPIVENDAKGVAPLVLAYIETLFRKEK